MSDPCSGSPPLVGPIKRERGELVTATAMGVGSQRRMLRPNAASGSRISRFDIWLASAPPVCPVPGHRSRPEGVLTAVPAGRADAAPVLHDEAAGDTAFCRWCDPSVEAQEFVRTASPQVEGSGPGRRGLLRADGSRPD